MGLFRLSKDSVRETEKRIINDVLGGDRSLAFSIRPSAKSYGAAVLTHEIGRRGYRDTDDLADGVEPHLARLTMAILPRDRAEEIIYDVSALDHYTSPRTLEEQIAHTLGRAINREQDVLFAGRDCVVAYVACVSLEAVELNRMA